MANKTTIKGLVKTTIQLTAQEILNGRYHHNKRGWVKTNLREKEFEKAVEMIAFALGGRKQNQLRAVLSRVSPPQHWGLSRILFVTRSGKLIAEYCAGQDFSWETNEIRKALYKLW